MPAETRGDGPLDPTTLREAQRRNDVKDELLAALAHDLRSPLGSLLVWLELLKGQELDPATARAVGKVESGVRDVRDMVLRFLDMTQIVSGTLRVELGSADLGAVAASALDAVKATADAKGVILHRAIDSSLPSLRADARCLRHGLHCLLARAVEQSPQEGSVELAVSRADDRILFRVRDAGAGLRADAARALGEALGAGIGPEGGGPGLAVAVGVARLHGGRVLVASKGEGRGCVFTLDLPLVPPPVTSRAGA